MLGTVDASYRELSLCLQGVIIVFVLFYTGFKKLMNHRVYDGEVSFLPSGCAESHPQDNTWCKAGYGHYS